MMHRYFVTTRLHEVFDDAYAVAEPDEITASHLLLALLREGKSLGACYLHIRGIPTRELAAELEQELGVRVGRHRTGVPDRPWTPDGEAWLRAAHEEATGLWPDHAEIRKVASTETLLLALLAKAPRHLAPYGVGHADCVAVIRWAHEPADSRPPLPPFLA